MPDDDKRISVSRSFLLDLLGRSRELACLMGVIDTIEVMAVHDMYMPVERVLLALGRTEAAQVIAERKGEK